MPVTIYPTNLKYKNSNGQFQSATAIKGDSGAAITVQVEGTSPTIVCEDNHRYICGEVLSLNITLPDSGIVDVVFESGTTATVLTITPPTGVTEVEWADGFDPSNLSANATYCLKIIDGKLGVAIAWGVQSNGGNNESWEYINTVYNGNEDSQIISCTEDANGNPIKLKAVAVFVYSAGSENITANMPLRFGFTPEVGYHTAHCEPIIINAAIRPTATNTSGWISVQGFIPIDTASSTNGSTILIIGGQRDGSLTKGELHPVKNIDDGYIREAYVSGNYFGPGSYIIVYGIKA